MKLSEAQRRALTFARENGVELFQHRDNGWRWFGKLPNGMVAQVAANPTILTLIECGYLERTSMQIHDRRVSITPAGRQALTDKDG